MKWILLLSACILLTPETDAQKTFYECYNTSQSASNGWRYNAHDRRWYYEETEVTKRCCDGYEKWDGRCVNELYKVCGRSSDISPFIVGGTDATFGEYPWLLRISLMRWGSNDYDSGSCGGSLISKDWVLTAAHCLAFGLPIVRVVENPKMDEMGTAITPQAVFVHSDFDSTNKVNDIGLIKLSEKVIFNDYVKPICLPDSNFTVRIDDEVEIAGWGRISTYGPESSILQKANVKVSECYPRQLHRKEICVTDGEGNVKRQACFGDSGSPLMLRRNGVVTVIGVDSYGTGACASGYPEAYTDVRRYLDWIEYIINNY